MFKLIFSFVNALAGLVLFVVFIVMFFKGQHLSAIWCMLAGQLARILDEIRSRGE